MSFPKPEDETPAIRKLRGRIGALALHAHHDGRSITAGMRARSTQLLNQRLLDEIDEGSPGLWEPERMRRLLYARSQYFASLALKSAKARQRRKSTKPLHPKTTETGTEVRDGQ